MARLTERELSPQVRGGVQDGDLVRYDQPAASLDEGILSLSLHFRKSLLRTQIISTNGSVPSSIHRLGLENFHQQVSQGGVTHTAPSKYHDKIILLVFIYTKYG